MLRRWTLRYVILAVCLGAAALLALALIVYIFKTPTDFGYTPNNWDLIFDFLDKWASAGTPAMTLLVVAVALGIGVATLLLMRKQRYLASQPWVFPKLVTDEGQFADPRTPLLFMNVGNGLAIDLKPFISDGDVAKIQDEWRHRTGPSDSRRTGPRWSALKAGTSISWPGAFEDPRTGPGVIGIEYQDIYGREFLSGWAYRIGKVDERLALVPDTPLLPVERLGGSPLAISC